MKCVLCGREADFAYITENGLVYYCKDCFKDNKIPQQPYIQFCNEQRIYHGPKCSQIPKGEKVRLLCKIYAGKNLWWRVGVFEWNGRRFVAPLRILWRCKE